jgi:hypothetical protein
MHRGALFATSVMLAGLLFADPAFARRPSTYCTLCARDTRGKIKRSSSERMKFLKSHGLTRTPPGMQVDHIIPLSKGGADRASNMQLIPKDSLKERHELR